MYDDDPDEIDDFLFDDDEFDDEPMFAGSKRKAIAEAERDQEPRVPPPLRALSAPPPLSPAVCVLQHAEGTPTGAMPANSHQCQPKCTNGCQPIRTNASQYAPMPASVLAHLVRSLSPRPAASTLTGCEPRPACPLAAQEGAEARQFHASGDGALRAVPPPGGRCAEAIPQGARQGAPSSAV